MKKERLAILISMGGSCYIAILGIVFAILARSEAILMDGFFSLTEVIMSLLTLKVIALVHDQNDNENYQMGYYAFEPLLNTVKGLIILLLCCFSFATSIKYLFNGGREMDMGLAVIYTIFGLGGSAVIVSILYYYSRTLNSPIMAVEYKGWLAAAALTFAITIAFTIGYFLQETSYAYVVPYLDPCLVCLLVVLLLPIPLKILWTSVNQLLGGPPEKEIQQKLRKKIEDLASPYQWESKRIRMMQVGRNCFVVVHVLVGEKFSYKSIEDLDFIRNLFLKELRTVYRHLNLEILFTQEEQWLTLYQETPKTERLTKAAFENLL